MFFPQHTQCQAPVSVYDRFGHDADWRMALGYKRRTVHVSKDTNSHQHTLVFALGDSFAI